MKKFTIITICLLFICSATFYIISVPRNITNVEAISGILDLRGHNFNKSLFRLDGEWEFYYNNLYTPANFIDQQPEDISYINVPSSWDMEGHPLHGYATYRLTVLTDEAELLMLIPEIYDASIIWINGRNVFNAGKVWGTEAGHKTSVRNAFINIRPQDGQFEIIVQVENYNWFNSGINYSFELGRSGVLVGDAIMRRLITAVFIGLLFAMFIYHAALFAYRRKEWVYLIFSLLCLTGVIRFTLETNGLAVLFLPNGLGAGLANFHILILTSQAFLLALFSHAIFDIPWNNKVRVLIYAITFGLPLLVALLPYGALSPIVTVIFLIPFLIIFYDVIRAERLKENPYYMLFVIALMMYIILPFVFAFGFENRLYMAPIAHNLFLVLSQCLILSLSYAETKRHEEVLLEQNDVLEKLSHAKTTFLQEMRHEIKNPLTVIATGIDYIDDQISSPDGDISKAKKALANLQAETQRIGRMLDGMADLAFISVIVNRERMNIGELLNDSVESFRIAAAENNITWSLKLADGLKDVYVERDKFVQVISNILSNAITYTKFGKITLSAEYDNKFVSVHISDTGTGIPAEILPRVFERGISLSGGTGYGLFISKTIVEAHGGTMSIISEPDDGTTVTFTVPVYGGQEAGSRRLSHEK